MSREVMQQALDMLNEIADDVYCDQKIEAVITALRQALETEKQWVGLTDDEIEDIYFDKFSMSELEGFARSIEQALKDKNKW